MICIQVHWLFYLSSPFCYWAYLVVGFCKIYFSSKISIVFFFIVSISLLRIHVFIHFRCVFLYLMKHSCNSCFKVFDSSNFLVIQGCLLLSFPLRNKCPFFFSSFLLNNIKLHSGYYECYVVLTPGPVIIFRKMVMFIVSK